MTANTTIRALLAFGSLAAAVFMRGSDKVLRYSVDRPAVELLYLPVPHVVKLPAKSFIDTVVWRAGDGLAGVTVLVFATMGGLGPVQLSWVTLPLLGLWPSSPPSHAAAYIAQTMMPKTQNVISD